MLWITFSWERPKPWSWSAAQDYWFNLTHFIFVILDSYNFGDVSRLSPEAPVPILNFQSADYKLGGAANVAMNITSLGAKCSLVGTIGIDKEGNIIKDLCTKNNIKTTNNE